MLEVQETKLEGVKILRPKKFEDSRGFFSETYNARSYAACGIVDNFVQDNYSFSLPKGVLRGLHYQREPYAQAKLVRVTQGRVFDVAVDIRPHSPTFLQWVGVELSAENWKQLYIPAGFAHGFLTLEEGCGFSYKVSNYYDAKSDGSIRFDDPAIGIAWPSIEGPLVLSEKDKAAPLVKEAYLV